MLSKHFRLYHSRPGGNSSTLQNTEITECIVVQSWPETDLALWHGATGLVYRVTWEDRSNGNLFHHCVTAQFRVEALRGDKKIKRRVTEELEHAKSKTHDLTGPLCGHARLLASRGAVAAAVHRRLACAHEHVRRVTNQNIAACPR